MNRRIHVEIIVLPNTANAIGGYGIHRLARHWIAAGHRVTINDDLATPPGADICIAHLDLSHVPDEYLSYANRHSLVLNGQVGDLRRRRYSPLLVDRDTEWDGPVIVKSDLNFGGMPELGWARKSGAAPPGRLVKPSRYPIFRQPAEVPEEYWTDPWLVVERFVPELENERFHVRSYQFLGNAYECFRFASDRPIVKFSEDRVAVEPHPAIIEARRRLLLDYGKLDYVVVEGVAWLLDANKTTGAGREQDTARQRRRHAQRAAGLYDYFDGLTPFAPAKMP